MLVITGTQRSGTSMTAQYLTKMGINVGSDLWHDDINGGLENIDICLWYRKKLKIPDFPFSDLPEKEDFIDLKDMDLKAVKFSFLLMQPELVRIWLKERHGKKDKFLVLMRNLHDVFKSKRSTPERRERFKKDTAILNQNVPMLYQNFHHSLQLLAAAHADVRLFSFPDICYNLDLPKTLYIWGGIPEANSPKGHLEWENLVDHNKITNGQKR